MLEHLKLYVRLTTGYVTEKNELTIMIRFFLMIKYSPSPISLPSVFRQTPALFHTTCIYISAPSDFFRPSKPPLLT